MERVCGNHYCGCEECISIDEDECWLLSLRELAGDNKQLKFENEQLLKAIDDLITDRDYFSKLEEIAKKEVADLRAENDELKAENGWRYDDPPRGSCSPVILAAMLRTDRFACEHLAIIDTVQWKPFLDRWSGTKENYRDCRLLCWQLINWDV